MGRKYIIELEEPEMFDERKYYKCSQMPWWSVSESIVENLTPYTEPDLEQIRKEAYEAGMNSNAVKIADDKAHESYQKGLSDAWEAARKIILDKEDGGFDAATYGEVFGYGKGFGAVLKKFTASEVIEKIRQYEQRQEEIIDPDKNKVEALANDIGIHKLYALVKEIRGE